MGLGQVMLGEGMKERSPGRGGPGLDKEVPGQATCLVSAPPGGCSWAKPGDGSRRKEVEATLFSPLNTGVSLVAWPASSFSTPLYPGAKKDPDASGAHPSCSNPAWGQRQRNQHPQINRYSELFVSVINF